MAGQMLFCLGLTCERNVTVEKESGAEVSASSATEHGDLDQCTPVSRRRQRMP